ncbi:MAG: L,D-transpeptidase family protein, partial [Ahrensia sp.]
DDSIDFPDNLLLKPGTANDALPLVIKAIKRNLRAETRQVHQASLDTYTGSINYDEALVALVRDVQRDLGLAPDGIVGPKTAARLGGESPDVRIAKITYAMERLRWHPEQYGDRQVVINQPEFRVRYMENGKTALAMNVVVGTLQNQTYFFHDEIETVVFNPYWGVPQSIIVNEFLPKLHRDPGYLDRAGYVVSTYGGKQVSSSSVNWRQYSSGVPFNVRQKPGPKNALGELKILFPNEHAIYMHDTPAKSLFARDSRAYSHGCVRLEDPRAMAAAVLGKDMSYVRSQLGGYEHAERVSDKVPVYVSYFTAWPDDSGAIAYHADVYKRDEHLQKALATVASARKG